MKELVSRLAREEEGASMVEYVLLLALIAVVCIAAVTAVGSKASAQFDAVQGKL
ncbi:MAG TPA: Flp family type IVb pilin [Armatimonadota bacterium]|jgi:pilus assembly protein Flp/PilA